MSIAWDISAVEQSLANARQQLLACRGSHRHWEGQLSSSALSTATALFALHLWRQGSTLADCDDSIGRRITAGLQWLVATQNADGGWGDTVLSLSNISTTALCWAALSAAPDDRKCNIACATAESWLASAAGGLAPARLAEAIRIRYGADRTFSVPILTMLALAGWLGPSEIAWRQVPQLPFELAACPHQWFKWLRLPVVSYALPALIAIGNLRHVQRPTRNPVAWLARRFTQRRALEVLDEIQPASGGFLEATPLTSFVVMSLLGAGLHEHPVARRGVEFLLQSARDDGSWPIDTNLATWVTTLAIGALGANHESLAQSDRAMLRQWLLEQQYRQEHPYTHAAPGGWAWTDLSGGVPDADDTPSALLALRILAGHADVDAIDSATAGVHWLLDLQNSDGGLPTFCRGWGSLPFDRSSADLTAHAIRAWSAWRESLPAASQAGVDTARQLAARFLINTQRLDGAWVPLWFGNQHVADELNLTYGTSRVLRAGEVYAPSGRDAQRWDCAMQRGVQWLLSSQNPDGGWSGAAGTPSSIEETALALDALAAHVGHTSGLPTAILKRKNGGLLHAAVARGVAWLIDRTSGGTQFPATPIGFYFAKLWYFEQLYPLIYTVGALERLVAACRAPA